MKSIVYPVIDTSFQINLLRQLIKDGGNSNIIISPLSIYMILSLTANGAKGNTLKQMLSILCQPNIEEVNKSNTENILSKGINIANGIFIRDTNIKTNFKNVGGRYKATIDKLVSSSQINEYVKEKTIGKIPHIIDSLESDIKMILINAVYFKGEWKKEFKKPILKDFTLSSGEVKKCNMMSLKSTFGYIEDKDCQMIKLEYKNGNVCYVIKPSTNINTFINNTFNQNFFKTHIAKLQNETVNLSLPKFTSTYSTNLEGVLKSMGMVEPFSDNADFSEMSNTQIKIGQFIHKTFLDVNPKTTEATAVTVVLMQTKGMVSSKKPKEYFMNVNKPFIFIIANIKNSNTVMFLSKIESV